MDKTQFRESTRPVTRVSQDTSRFAVHEWEHMIKNTPLKYVDVYRFLLGSFLISPMLNKIKEDLNKPARKDFYPLIIVLILAIPVIFRGEILEKGHASNSLTVTQCYEATLYSPLIATSNFLIDLLVDSNTSCPQTSYDALVARTPYLTEGGFMPTLLNVLHMAWFTILTPFLCLWNAFTSMLELALGCHVQNILSIHQTYSPTYVEALLWICPLYIIFHILAYHCIWKLWEVVKGL
jgi:hypothetical protein